MLFPLSSDVWKTPNDSRNLRGAALDPEFGVFFGIKTLHHKGDRPCLNSAVQHLKDLWFGMGRILKKGNWPEVSLKIKHLSTLIQKYGERICSQTERQMRLFNTEQAARNVENSAHLSIIESLLHRLALSSELLHLLNINIVNNGFYVRIEVNNYM